MAVFEYDHLVPEVLLFVDRRCYPDWKIIRNRIDFHDLTFVVGGKADYYVNGVKHTAEAGNLIYIPPGSVREARTYADSPMHSYAFNFCWLPPNNETPMPLATITKFRLTGPLLEQIKAFNQIWMSKQPGYKMQARGQFLLILHRLLVSAVHRTDDLAPDPRIERMKAYLAENYAEDIDIGRLAELAGLHPVYLGRLFKQQTGVSYRAFLNTIRVNNAEAMLAAGGFTVSEVAERCGFRDVAYFSNVFKAVKGYPPSSIAAKGWLPEKI